MAEGFARPALELPRPMLGGLEVAAAASAGQGLALDETGRIPHAALGVLTGIITSAGAITAGTGFTVTKNGTGDYTVTFTTPFTATPLVLPSVVTTNAYGAIVASQSTTSCRIVTFATTTGAAVDAAFNFMAQVPR